MLGCVANKRRTVELCAAGIAVAMVAFAGPASAKGYNPPYSSLVVDANTGKVLQSDSADAIRHPASLTKVMTLYMLFEALDSGRVSLSTPFTVSSHCAGMAPSKLGFRPGQTIQAEDAIKAVVTKSANDVACAIAENLGGSESNFARQMTRQARRLGMTKTVYVNASGLPDNKQITTARDLVILGRAIQDRFPKYYRYFNTRSFTWRGHTIGNHNRLLGRVKGVDGIKTGFIRASGFNLLTSMHDDGRYIVAVVLGGKSGRSRDAQMRKLLATYSPKASRSRSTPLVADARDDVRHAVPLPKPAPEEKLRPAVVAAAVPAPVAAPQTIAEAVGVYSEPAQTAENTAAKGPAVALTPKQIAARVETAMATTTPSARGWVVGPQPVASGSASAYADGSTPGTAPALQAAEAIMRPSPKSQYAAASMGDLPTPGAALPRKAEPAQAAPVQTASLDPEPAPAPVERKGWLIQIAATADIDQAKTLLDRAQSKARVLARAEAYTEPYEKSGTTLYRARFAGLNERSATAACKALKRSSMACYTIKN